MSALLVLKTRKSLNEIVLLSAVVQPQKVCCCRSNLRVQGLGRELVPPLTLLVVQQHHSVHSAHRELSVIRRPGHASDFGSAILEKKNTLLE